MTPNTALVLIVFTFAALGSPIGAFLIWLVGSTSIAVFDVNIIPLLAKQETLPFTWGFLSGLSAMSYLFGLIPSVLSGLYFAHHAVKLKPIEIGNGVAIAFFCSLLNGMLLFPFIIHAVIAGTFSYWVLHSFIAHQLRNTKFELVLGEGS